MPDLHSWQQELLDHLKSINPKDLALQDENQRLFARYGGRGSSKTNLRNEIIGRRPTVIIIDDPINEGK